MVVVDPQQDEQVNQVIGLLGGKMAVGKLEAAAGLEKEGWWALGQFERKGEGKTLPPLPPPQSLQAREMRPPQPLLFSFGDEQEESLSSPLQLKQQQQQKKRKPSPAFSFSSFARGLQLARPRVEGLRWAQWWKKRSQCPWPPYVWQVPVKLASCPSPTLSLHR